MRLLCLLVVLVSFTASAQVVHEPQSWVGLFSSGPLAGRFMGWFDAHTRFAFGSQPQTSVLLRPGVGYRVRDDMTVWLGYLWAPVWRNGQRSLDEHRIWQQWTWDVALPAGAKLQLRSRLEERFAAGEVGIRFRQFVRAQTAPLQGTPVFLVAWDEVFIAFNDTRFGQRAGFDQNRLFLGVAQKVTPQVRVEGGYFNQFLPRAVGTPSPMRHVAMLNVFVNW